MSADTDMVERDYTEALTKLAMIAVDVISENEGVPTHLIAMAIVCRIVEQYPDVNKLVARAALDASGIGELVGLVEESLYHLRLDDRAKDYHNRALAALSRARATVGNTHE